MAYWLTVVKLSTKIRLSLWSCLCTTYRAFNTSLSFLSFLMARTNLPSCRLASSPISCRTTTLKPSFFNNLTISSVIASSNSPDVPLRSIGATTSVMSTFGRRCDFNGLKSRISLDMLFLSMSLGWGITCVWFNVMALLSSLTQIIF